MQAGVSFPLTISVCAQRTVGDTQLCVCIREHVFPMDRKQNSVKEQQAMSNFDWNPPFVDGQF